MANLYFITPFKIDYEKKRKSICICFRRCIWYWHGYLYTPEISKEIKIEEVLDDKDKQEIEDKMDVQPYAANSNLLKY